MTTTATAPTTAPVQQEFLRPFPALTSAERYHFEVFGYVIVPGVFTRDECGRMYDALQRLRRDLRAANPRDTMKSRLIGNARFAVDKPHHVYVVSMFEYDESLRNYACHPRCVGMAEEIMGCEARITETDAHVNSRDPEADLSKPPVFPFHHGVDIPFGSHIGPNNLYHCNFIKTLTNLTDLGPDDGGTMVIAGSHKLTHLPVDEIIAATGADRRLIHSVVAPAGSTLLFFESTIHSAGIIQSGRDRLLIIGGYTPALFQAHEGYDPEPGLIDRVPSEVRPLLNGSNRYKNWLSDRRTRTLSQPAEELSRA